MLVEWAFSAGFRLSLLQVVIADLLCRRRIFFVRALSKCLAAAARAGLNNGLVGQSENVPLQSAMNLGRRFFGGAKAMHNGNRVPYQS